ncbi:hypothetical protein BGZ63DRAFT_377627 [Mariannaea sp. PMI_226]|nr:hypothetical protein BGZ63DRAFT_377627 [Mariannaea sp. PMI_226]
MGVNGSGNGIRFDPTYALELHNFSASHPHFNRSIEATAADCKKLKPWPDQALRELQEAQNLGCSLEEMVVWFSTTANVCAHYTTFLHCPKCSYSGRLRYYQSHWDLKHQETSMNCRCPCCKANMEISESQSHICKLTKSIISLTNSIKLQYFYESQLRCLGEKVCRVLAKSWGAILKGMSNIKDLSYHDMVARLSTALIQVSSKKGSEAVNIATLAEAARHISDSFSYQQIIRVAKAHEGYKPWTKDDKIEVKAGNLDLFENVRQKYTNEECLCERKIKRFELVVSTTLASNESIIRTCNALLVGANHVVFGRTPTRPFSNLISGLQQDGFRPFDLSKTEYQCTRRGHWELYVSLSPNMGALLANLSRALILHPICVKHHRSSVKPSKKWSRREESFLLQLKKVGLSDIHIVKIMNRNILGILHKWRRMKRSHHIDHLY